MFANFVSWAVFVSRYIEVHLSSAILKNNSVIVPLPTAIRTYSSNKICLYTNQNGTMKIVAI